MARSIPGVTNSELTPAQAADVIVYYDTAENATSRRNGWRPKVQLGRVAIHTTQPRHSILADGAPALSPKEASEGLEYLQGDHTTHSHNEWPIEPTDDQNAEIDSLVDKVPCSYDDAYARVMGVWPHRKN